MTGAAVGGRPVLATVAGMLRRPRGIHRAGMCRLQPRTPEGRGGEQQHERQQARAAKQADHRGLRYVLTTSDESGRHRGPCRSPGQRAGGWPGAFLETRTWI